MNSAPIKNLLSQVNTLSARYQKINELTGDNFNVFRILKLEASEVRMHSAFLAELLNPKGSHGQKDTFLKLFIQQFCFRGTQFDTHTAEVSVEKYIGLVNYEDPEGGRIDIYIKDKNNNYLTIENKIYASDQEGQLSRYHKHAKQSDLFYLTLDGGLPSEKSRGTLKEGEDYKCLSYNENIINWLEACRKEVAVLPLVREAISHYINLIKHLTNQTTNHNMEQELTELMKADLKAAFSIAGNLNSTLQKIADDFAAEVKDATTKLGVECFYNISLNQTYTGIYIYKPEWQYVNIVFQFQSRNRDMIYGFAAKSSTPKTPIILPDNLWLKLSGLPNNTSKKSTWWPWFNDMEETYKDWNKPEAYNAIADGTMLKDIIQKTQMLLDMTKNIKL